MEPAKNPSEVKDQKDAEKAEQEMLEKAKQIAATEAVEKFKKVVLADLQNYAKSLQESMNAQTNPVLYLKLQGSVDTVVDIAKYVQGKQ